MPRDRQAPGVPLSCRAREYKTCVPKFLGLMPRWQRNIPCLVAEPLPHPPGSPHSFSVQEGSLPSLLHCRKNPSWGAIRAGDVCPPCPPSPPGPRGTSGTRRPRRFPALGLRARRCYFSALINTPDNNRTKKKKKSAFIRRKIHLEIIYSQPIAAEAGR